ncbi:hypothetical protein ES703_71796 [subsurface metagenome]
MLLIDGVEYELWTPPKEDKFERIIEEHAQDIFGLCAIYVSRKQKLRSFAGIASIPDGYVIDVDADRWHVVEIELASHPLHEHIVSQLSKFINGIKNPSTQRQIVAALYEEIQKDHLARECLEASLNSKEVYKYLSDLVAEPPVLTIVIDNSTQELEEAVASLAHPDIKVVEFRTFLRAAAGPGGRWDDSAGHAHLFEPLHPYARQLSPIQVEELYKRVEKITVKDLIEAGIIRPGDVIHKLYKGQRYEGKIPM